MQHIPAKTMNTFFYKAAGLKKFSSILLLLVFTLGITPKKTLHTWFANHKDSTSSIPNGKTQQLTKAGFNCNCDDLVAESHFITFINVINLHISVDHPLVSSTETSFLSRSLFHIDLRGPPFRI